MKDKSMEKDIKKYAAFLKKHEGHKLVRRTEESVDSCIVWCLCVTCGKREGLTAEKGKK